jgi:hypothetical protein
MLKELKWEPLVERRARYKAVMIYRINHQVAINPEAFLRPSTTHNRGHTH